MSCSCCPGSPPPPPPPAGCPCYCQWPNSLHVTVPGANANCGCWPVGDSLEVTSFYTQPPIEPCSANPNVPAGCSGCVGWQLGAPPPQFGEPVSPLLIECPCTVNGSPVPCASEPPYGTCGFRIILFCQGTRFDLRIIWCIYQVPASSGNQPFTSWGILCGHAFANVAPNMCSPPYLEIPLVSCAQNTTMTEAAPASLWCPGGLPDLAIVTL